MNHVTKVLPRNIKRLKRLLTKTLSCMHVLQNVAAQRGLEAAKVMEVGAEEESASGGGADDVDSVAKLVDASNSDLKIVSRDSCQELSRAE